MTSGRGKDIFSTHDAARICRVTPMTVIRWIKEGKLPAFKTAGGHRRILRQDLDRFCRSRGIPFAPDGEQSAGRILVVDPDSAVRDLIADAARAVDETLVIELAGDAFAAGRLVSSFRPNLIFLDQKLPGIDALELVSMLTRDPDTATTAIVILAGALTGDLERAFKTRGAQGCLRRPPPAEAIDRLVRTTFRITGGGLPAPSVMLIDGDGRALRTLRRELEDNVPGCRVTMFDNCLDALLAIGADPPDLVVLDMGRQEVDCIDLIKRIRRVVDKQVTVVAIADAEREDLRATCTAAGARDFLLKPLTLDRLVSYVAVRK